MTIPQKCTAPVITGLGVISAIGDNISEFTTNLFAGKSGVGPVTSFCAGRYLCNEAAEVKNLQAPANFERERDRTVWLACRAADEAVQNAGLSHDETEGARTALVFGTSVASVFAFCRWKQIHEASGQNPPFGPPLHLSPARVAALLSERFHVSAGVMTVVTACSAGASAITMAADLIRLNRADVVIACAADPLSELSFSGFNGLNALSTTVSRPFDQSKSGVILGEGGGAIILEAQHHAERRGARIFGTVAGYGLSNDAHHPTQPDPSAGGAIRSIIRALADANVNTAAMGYINAHGTSTKYNDLMELTAVREVYGPDKNNIPISSIKPMIGHTLGAAGMIEAIATILALYHQQLPPTLNFEQPIAGYGFDFVPASRPVVEANVMSSHSFAFGGNAACIVFTKYSPDRRTAK